MMFDRLRPGRIRYSLGKLRQHPAPAKFVAARLLMRHGRLSERLFIHHRLGFRMRFFPTSLSAALWADPNSRRHDEVVLEAILEPGGTCVDIGANVGSLVLVGACLVGAQGHVVAVEAHPTTASYLRQNVELNHLGQVRLFPVALGAKAGEARISDRRSDDQNALVDRGIPIEVKRLDDIAPEGPIDLLKIDVEGFELMVLRGARDTLKRSRVVYCELSKSSCERFGYEPSAIEQLLLAADFVLLHQHGERWVVHNKPAYGRSADLRFDPTGYNFIAARVADARMLATRLNSWWVG